MPNTKPIGVAYLDPAFESVSVSGAVTAGSLVGPLTGAVTGNVTGNTAGVHTGAVTGAVTGNWIMPAASVAATGSTQANAALIATGFTLVTAADATTGVKLPAAAAGLVCIVKNDDAANAILKIWPNTSDQINAVTVDASFSIAAKTSVILVALNAVTWYSVPLLPS
jgi:hypothetical protein